MVWPAFTLKARARDMALTYLRPLLAMQPLPTNFWDNPYAVGFITGCVEGVAMLVAGHKNSSDFVSSVQTRVLRALISNDEMVVRIFQRFARPEYNPEFREGLKNGKFFALFFHGDREADATELAAEAFRQARERAPEFNRLTEKTDLRGRAAMILCEALFFHKMRFRVTADGNLSTHESLNILREAEAQGYALGVEKDGAFSVTKHGTTYLRSNDDIQRFARLEKISPRLSERSSDTAVDTATTKEEPGQSSDTSPAADYLFAAFRLGLEGEDREVAALIIEAIEAERRKRDINDVIEAEIFAKLFNEDRQRLGEDEVAIKDVVAADIQASIVVKFVTKEITEAQMHAEIKAALDAISSNNLNKADLKEAEMFAGGLGTLKALRGEVTDKDIVEAKISAKIFTRALAKLRAKAS
jgi:hypothetical protein